MDPGIFFVSRRLHGARAGLAAVIRRVPACSRNPRNRLLCRHAGIGGCGPRGPRGRGGVLGRRRPSRAIGSWTPSLPSDPHPTVGLQD